MPNIFDYYNERMSVTAGVINDLMPKRSISASWRLDSYQRARADQQSTVITGYNPTQFDATHPINLFIIQLFIIIVFTQGLGYVLGKIKQPKVIAEVIGGIILGPTVMGRIPGFTYRIFPQQSISYLNLIANIGLILFLFLIGLEVDVAVMKKNGRNSAIISVAGMVLPFGLGAAIAVPIYNHYVDQSVTTFGHFMLFVGVAMSITAFPVLCRILTSLQLLEDRVGVIVLAAGVGNDVVGWVLLALTLALVNADAGVTAVYVLLCAVGWSVILLFPIRWGFVWLARRTGSLSHGPTPGMMTITLLIVFASSFVTGIIGVHPIFGAFIAGLIVPHEGGFAIAFVEKIEDLISMLFIPIYFVLSGLSTNLGLLDEGRDWGYIIALCVLGWFGKFFGCGGAAKLLGYNLRESGAIGMLMSCKGLVELIVLNVGLSAGIINQRLFSMFVVEALVLTFVTAPFTLLIYPQRHRVNHNPVKNNAIGDSENDGAVHRVDMGAGGRERTSKFLVVLQKMEHLSAVMFLTQMLEPPTPKASLTHTAVSSKRVSMIEDNGDLSIKTVPSETNGVADLVKNPESSSSSASASSSAPVQIDALRLIELTGRTYSVMQSAEKDQMLRTDDALQLYRQFGRLRGLDVTPHISIVEADSFPSAVADHAGGLDTELVVIPWTIPNTGSSSTALIDTSTAGVAEKEGLTASTSTSLSPFDHIFGTESTNSPMYSHFIRRVFSETSADLALFVDRGFGSSAMTAAGTSQHIFLPFLGGPDDRLALRLVVQLCHHSHVTATVVRISRTDEEASSDAESSHKAEDISDSVRAHQNALHSNQLTVGPASSAYPGTAHRLASETADDLAWHYYTTPTTSPPRSSTLDSALSRISFRETKSATPLAHAYAAADASAVGKGNQWRPLLIVSGRGRRGATVNVSEEASKWLSERSLSPSVGAELRKTVGDVVTALVLGGGQPSSASFLVLEAKA